MRKIVKACALAIVLSIGSPPAHAVGIPVIDAVHTALTQFWNALEYARQQLQLNEAIEQTRQLIEQVRIIQNNARALAGIARIYRDVMKIWNSGKGLYYQIVGLTHTDIGAVALQRLWALQYYTDDGAGAVEANQQLYHQSVYEKRLTAAQVWEQHQQIELDNLESLARAEEARQERIEVQEELRSEVQSLDEESLQATLMAMAGQNGMLIEQNEATISDLEAIRAQLAEDRRQKLEQEARNRSQAIHDTRVLIEWQPQPWIAGSMFGGN